MKRIAVLLFGSLALVLALSSCGQQSGDGSSATADTARAPMSILSSPDKYTYYIKDYVNMNLGNVGTYKDYDWTYGPGYYDKYGNALVKLNIVADDGSFVDYTNIDSRKDYRVVSQSPEPNTELKLTFKKYSDGREQETVESQTVDTITLNVTKTPEAKNKK